MSRLLKFIVFAISLLTVHSLESFPFETHIYKVKEEITPPHEWFNVGQPLVEHKVHLRIGLPFLSFSELEKQLYEVSDPDHHRYGQHLSKAEVEALITPSRDSVDAVNTWLSSFGLTERDITRSPANDWVTIKVPIGVAEKMLDTVSFSCSYRPLTEECIKLSRNTTFGNISRVATASLGPLAIAFPFIFTNISTSFNPLLFSTDFNLMDPQ